MGVTTALVTFLDELSIQMWLVSSLFSNVDNIKYINKFNLPLASDGE